VICLGKSHNKGTKFEREIGKLMLEYDGNCPKWGNLTTECARAGQLSNLKMDILSRTYAIEAKHRKGYPKWIFEKLKNIQNGKEPLLVINGQFIIHTITQERHIELIKKEKIYENDKKDLHIDKFEGYNTIKIEKKNSPDWLFGDMKQIVDIAERHNKEALFVIKKDARSYPILHLLTPKRHSDLLEKEKYLDNI